MRKTAAKKNKQVDETALKLAEFVMVFTTVGKTVLDTREVLELYRVRWQIEFGIIRLSSYLLA